MILYNAHVFKEEINKSLKWVQNEFNISCGESFC